jgi:hypothetical protein
MPTVTLPYVPANGTTLDADQLNRDFYSSGAGESVYEVSNGKLEALTNFSPLFFVFNGMLRPLDVAFAQSSGLLQSQDFIEQVWGAGDKQRNVPGACITWYQREPASVTVVNIGYHMSWWRTREGITQDPATDIPGPDIITDLYLDDDVNPIAGMRRRCPMSMFPSPYGGTPITAWNINEATLARYQNLHFSVKDLTPGWHTASLRIKVRQNSQNMTTDGSVYQQPAGVFQAMHRVRMRVRNATVLSLW